MRCQANEEFEVDGVAHAFSTFYFDEDDSLLELGDLNVFHGHRVCGDYFIFDSTTDDKHATVLWNLPGKYRLRVKFQYEQEKGDWVIEDKFDSVWAKRKKEQDVIETTKATSPGALAGINKEWEKRVQKIGTTVDYVAEHEKILKRTIILRDITAYNTGQGETRPYFEKFRHPTHLMTNAAINGELPKDFETRLAKVNRRELKPDIHAIIPAWFGRHFEKQGGQNQWALDQMGQKKILSIIILDKVTFLGWQEQHGVQAICCRDQGQPPLITGKMPHDWLRKHVNY
ncbi:hypothetical protein GN956_G14838 [Arapaima gigas]